MPIAMVMLIQVRRRYCAPVGERIVVNGLGELIAILVVLLAQLVVLGLQSDAIGRLVGQQLLSGFFVALFLGDCFVLLTPRFIFFHPLSVRGNTGLVKPIETVRIRIPPCEDVLPQMEVPIDDFAVVGPMDHLAATTSAWNVGVFDAASVHAFVDVLRMGGARREEQQDGDPTR